MEPKDTLPPLETRVLIRAPQLCSYELVAMLFKSHGYRELRWKVFNYHGSTSATMHRDFRPHSWRPFEIKNPDELTQPQKDERILDALRYIARERKSKNGGYFSRRDMAELARHTLGECGYSWEHENGRRE